MPLILVVDDTALARESVAKLLEFEGFKTVRAANGKEAYATLYSQTPDLVLLDLMMPEMDGITFLRMIRRHPRWETIPIIVLTGLNDENKLVARARELGVSDLVPKATFGFEDLLERVRKAIAMRANAPN
jgi:two-component system phosphate regulon response regulator PhoB